jgi:hypothetical protein
MTLFVKFNLVFVAVFLLGLAASGYVSWTLLQRNAQEEIVQNGRLLMEKSLAVRAYTANQIRPLLQTQMLDTFLPQTVPAYSATEVFNDLRKKFPEYSYKEATLNPTKPPSGKRISSRSFATPRAAPRSSASATRPPAAISTWPGPSRSPTGPVWNAIARWKTRRRRCWPSTDRPTASAGA